MLRAPGQPLDAATRAFMEPRLGHSFGSVRVHADARAAASARAVNALAYTVGRNVVFGAGQYAPGTREGQQVLAHELTHVVQQGAVTARGPIEIGAAGDHAEREADQVAHSIARQATAKDGQIASRSAGQPGPARLQRLIRTSLVNCPAGQNPFSADRRGSALLDNALKRITAARAARPANPADPDVVAVGDALHTAFRLNPANNDTWTLGAPNVRLPVIQRRLESAKAYIDSVVFTIDCTGLACGTCGGEEAFTCAGNVTGIALCPLFWTRNLNQRGRIIAHEVFHIMFGFINDWGSPDVHNAHCYAQFVALLNGFNSPTGFRCH